MPDLEWDSIVLVKGGWGGCEREVEGYGEDDGGEHEEAGGGDKVEGVRSNEYSRDDECKG